MKLKIVRLDYKNPANAAFKPLPTASSFDGIDINEIRAIRIGCFSTIEEAELMLSKFPKSYKGYICISFSDTVGNYSVRFEFNTFWTNSKTGSSNESAIKRREKVIAKIKTIL